MALLLVSFKENQWLASLLWKHDDYKWKRMSRQCWYIKWSAAGGNKPTKMGEEAVKFRYRINYNDGSRPIKNWNNGQGKFSRCKRFVDIFFFNFEIHCDNFLVTFVNTKSIYGFQYKLPSGPFIKIDDVAYTEFKTRDLIDIPEGCTFPDGYKQCMEDYPGPDDEFDWEGICYKVNCS